MTNLPVRREVVVVPGGVLTMTVFHFNARPAPGAPPAALWQRVLRWLAAHD